MDPILIAAIVVIALLLGAALGWFLGNRPAAEWKARAGEQDEKVKDLVRDLATMSERAERADSLAADLDRVRTEREGLGAELATLKANAAHFEEQKRLLISAREEMLKEFQNTGSKVLGEAQEAFLKRAQERLGHTEKASEEKLKALLDPVDKRLKSYEEQVATLEAKRVDAFGQLTGLIASMREGQEEVRREAQRLGNSLTNAPKARGRWGERALQNVLEQCGLSQHTDFDLEQSMETDQGRLRPDAIVHVPGQKKLVIDAKVSLNAYQAAFEADDDNERKRHLDLHAKSMRTHVQQLGAKSYQSQFEEAPDYVVMFVPGEHFVAAALEADPELWDFAFKNGVLLATPTNLVAIARTVAQVWRQDQLASEAKEIGRLGTELYDRLAKVTEDLGKMGTHLGRAIGSYNDFARSFDSRVLVSARKMKEMGVEIGKREIEDVPLVEGAPRYTSEDVQERVSPALLDTGEREEKSDT